MKAFGLIEQVWKCDVCGKVKTVARRFFHFTPPDGWRTTDQADTCSECAREQ